MRLLRIVVAVFAFAADMAAQQLPFDVPLTYFVGAGGGNVSPFASPSAVVVGPGGDIWVAGVAQGHGLPIIDPDGRIPSEDSCYALGGDPPSPFEPRVLLDPCSDLFAMRLAADGSGPRFVKYLGIPWGFDTLDGASVDGDGNFHLFGTHAKSSRPFVERYRIKVGPDGETLEDNLELFVRTVGVGVDASGVVHRASYASTNSDGFGPGPDETWTIVTGTPEDQRESLYNVHLNR